MVIEKKNFQHTKLKLLKALIKKKRDYTGSERKKYD